jgi:hypothetical protein
MRHLLRSLFDAFLDVFWCDIHWQSGYTEHLSVYHICYIMQVKYLSIFSLSFWFKCLTRIIDSLFLLYLELIFVGNFSVLFFFRFFMSLIPESPQFSHLSLIPLPSSLSYSNSNSNSLLFICYVVRNISRC